MMLINRLRETRQRSGMTQRELAIAVDITERMLQRWEHGTSCPSVENALRLARVLGCRVEDLFCLSSEDKTSSSL